MRPCSPADLERLIPLLDEAFVFGKGRTVSLRLRFPTVFCHDNLHNLLLCSDGDEIASALAIRRFDWRDGSETFRGAMIGAVYTHPARRGKGFASHLLKMAETRLRAEKADFGVLWTGQPSFYARLGWVSADCGLLGEVEPGASMPEPPAGVTTMPIETGAPLLEKVRREWLNAMTLRRAEDYRQLPLPAERMDLLWREDAYALLGSSGTTGFLYELAGHPDGYPALWQEACRNRRRIFVNDRIDSPSCRWLTNHTRISWQNQNLAMWLPLSERVAPPRPGQWVIPYFDRI